MTYTLENRNILRDGVPIAYVERVQRTEGYALSPSELDEFARAVVLALNAPDAFEACAALCDVEDKERRGIFGSTSDGSRTARRLAALIRTLGKLRQQAIRPPVTRLYPDD
jgi:hypothetical protein